MDTTTLCAESYQRLKNLRAVENETGIPWPTVYVHLRRAGIAVTGDKAVYGSNRDRLAAVAEAEFARLVPFAINHNLERFQPPIDFTVLGHGVDIKAARVTAGATNGKYQRWAFSMKKQEAIADFIVCFGYRNDGTYECFLLPGEQIRNYMTISIGVAGRSKWLAYTVDPSSLSAFFRDLADARIAAQTAVTGS